MSLSSFGILSLVNSDYLEFTINEMFKSKSVMKTLIDDNKLHFKNQFQKLLMRKTLDPKIKKNLLEQLMYDTSIDYRTKLGILPTPAKIKNADLEEIINPILTCSLHNIIRNFFSSLEFVRQEPMFDINIFDHIIKEYIVFEPIKQTTRVFKKKQEQVKKTNKRKYYDYKFKNNVVKMKIKLR